MTDNKRAADDAEREAFEKYMFSTGIAWDNSREQDIDGDEQYADAETRVNFGVWQAALSSRADGGKGEAVALWAAFAPEGNLLAHSKLRPGLSDILNWEPLYRAAPQAECAPREAQPVGPRTTLNYDGTFDTTCAHCGGNGCFACLKSAAPTPERADADTAGAKPTCPHCGLTDIEFSRVCHNSACSGYAKEESFYRGWENTAAPASQERADAGKDAALTDEQIIEIFQDHYTEEPGDAEPGHILPFARAILAANKEPK